MKLNTISRCCGKTERRLLASGALILALSIGVAPSLAQEQPLLDPAAVEVFEQMSAHLAAAPTVHFSATAYREVVFETGIKAINGRRGIGLIQRPDKFFVTSFRDDGVQTRGWFDGNTLTFAMSGVLKDAQQSAYASITLPQEARSIDAALDFMIDEYDYVLQLGDLMYSDVQAALGEGLLSAEHLGRKIIEGRPCHHLSLEFVGVDAQLWVEEGDNPIPCRWALTLLDEPSEPMLISTFDSWANGATIEPGQFTFQAIADAEELEMQEILDMMGGAQ